MSVCIVPKIDIWEFLKQNRDTERKTLIIEVNIKFRGECWQKGRTISKVLFRMEYGEGRNSSQNGSYDGV